MPASRIISTNHSPDVPFDQSINPYQGCEHGCIYCYARPTHTWLGLSAGLDFETRLTYKPDVVRLLRRFVEVAPTLERALVTLDQAAAQNARKFLVFQLHPLFFIGKDILDGSRHGCCIKSCRGMGRLWAAFRNDLFSHSIPGLAIGAATPPRSRQPKLG